MTFTYDIANPDTTKALLSKVRLEIGDTTENAGVRPDGSNFSDEELTHWLTEEDNDVMQTAARACDALASAWSLMADETVGPRKVAYSKVSGNWSERATTLRGAYDSGVITVL